MLKYVLFAQFIADICSFSFKAYKQQTMSYKIMFINYVLFLHLQ